MTATAARPSSPLLELLNGFVVELRNAGLPVSLTENLDAMEAVQHIPIEDREAFKYALGATLVKNHAHWRAFETVFEVYFSLRGKEYDLVDGEWPDELDLDELQEQMQQGGQTPGQGGGGEGLDPEQLAEMLFQALLNGDSTMMRALARQAVRRYAGMEPGRPVGAPTTSTARCGTSTSTGSSTGSWTRPARTRPAISLPSRNGWSETSSRTGSTS